MSKRRHKPLRQVSDLSRLVVPVGASLTVILCVVGFIHFTQIALYQQAHFAPGAEHPDDGFAVACLFLGMAALAALLLSLRDPPPMRWRRLRHSPIVRSAKRRSAKGSPKRVRHSGTIVGR